MLGQGTRIGERRGGAGDSPAWAELTFLLIASLNYWTDLLRLAFSGADGALAFRLIHFAFYGGFLLLLTRRWQGALALVKRMPLLTLFLALPLASTLWSVNGEETLVRAVALIGCSLYAFYLAAQLHARFVLKLLAWTGALAAAISLVLIFAFPSVGLMSEGEYVNVWSGAFVHKNGLGQMTALGALISLIVLTDEGMRRNLVIVCGLGLNLLLLAGSQSLTAQVVFLAGVVMIFTLGRCLRFLVQQATAVAMVVAPLALLVAASLTTDHVLDLLAAAGKNATLSSRVPLWQILLDFIDDRFWLGWGYEAFFSDSNFAIRVIEAKLHFKPYYSHNGYIELWLGLGAVGFAWMAGLFATFAWRAARLLIIEPHHPLYLASFVYVPLFLLQNTAEVTILQRNSMSWVLFVLLYAMLALASPRPFASASARRMPRGQRQRARPVPLDVA